MSDSARELAELKREVIETRNQAIKTDHQVKNLALDVKGFENRFDGLDRRVKVSILGANVIVALTILGAAYGVNALRARNYENTIASLRGEVGQVQAAGEQRADRLKDRLAQLERAQQERVQAEQLAAQLLADLNERRERDATELLGKLRIDHLSELSRSFVEKRVSDLRRRAADASYRTARSLLGSGKQEAAVVELRRCLVFEPDGRHADAARYFLATNLWNLRRWDEAEPLLRDMLAKTPSSEEALQEEVRYLLASALAHQKRKDDARVLFEGLATAGGKYERSSKNYLAALDSGAELPDSAGGAARAAADSGAGSAATP